MTMPSLDQLNQLIAQAVSTTGELALVLSQEQQALEEQRFNDLARISETKQLRLLELDQLQQRMQVNGDTPDADGQLKQLLNDAFDQGDLPLWGSLKAMLVKVRHMNEHNERLLQKQLQRVQHLMHLLQPQQNLYSKEAKIHSSSSGHALGQA